MDGSIVLRDKEKQSLSEYIDNSLHHNSKQSLFICGLPGTGKTSTLHYIFKTKSVKQCQINCVELEKPKLIFETILRKLFKIKTSASTAYDLLVSNLENNFESNTLTFDTNQQTIFVTVDEADMLFTKNAEVFYNLVDLSQRLNSNCFSLILMSNRMDLIDTLPAKCKSRIGKNKLLFSSQNKDELFEILNQRMSESIFYQETPLKLCAARVYSVSGDARRVLQISNNSMVTFYGDVNTKFQEKYKVNLQEFMQDVFLVNIDNSSLKKIFLMNQNEEINLSKFIISLKDKITSEDIKKAYNDLQNNNSYIKQVNNFNDISKVIIESMVELKKQYSTEIIDQDLILERVYKKLQQNTFENKDLNSKDQLKSKNLQNIEDLIDGVKKSIDNLINSEIIMEQIAEGGIKSYKLEIPDDIIHQNQIKN